MINFKALSKLSELRMDNQKKVLLVIWCVAMVYLDVFFIMKPQLSFSAKFSSQIIKYKSDAAKFEKDILEMRKIKNNPAQMNVKAKGIRKIMTESEVGDLLQNIADLANKLDVKILQMRPLKDNTVQTEKVPALEKFTSLTIILDIVCDYHQLGKFINSLETGDIYIKISEIKVSAQQGEYFKQKASLIIKTYVKK